MSPDIDKNLITRKLALLDEYIGELEPIVKFSTEEILKDTLKLHTGEMISKELLLSSAIKGFCRKSLH